jgi:hypothetical protein
VQRGGGTRGLKNAGTPPAMMSLAAKRLMKPRSMVCSATMGKAQAQLIEWALTRFQNSAAAPRGFRAGCPQ